jgi:glyoxylase-like metal-dependent hydrolase (beta-lactamase superfamily II)
MARDIPDYPDFIDVWQRDTARILSVAFKDRQARNTRIRRANERWSKFVRRFGEGEVKLGDREVHLDRLLKDGDTFSTGKLQFRIVETPGHNTWHITPIETSIGFAFTGDLLIGNIPAIYDSLDGNLELFQGSMNRLLALRAEFPEMRFMPAHGEEIKNPERAIRIVLKTIGILENGILKKLVEGRKGLVELMESAFGSHIEGGNHFITALELLEALLRKLMREGRVGSQVYEEGYEEFYMKH